MRSSLLRLSAAVLALSTPVIAQATVRVVHAIPGLPAPVDVLDGSTTLFSFDFGDVETLQLPAGTYNLSVQLMGTTVLSASPVVQNGDDVTIVAHLDATGGNALSLFPNDISPLTLPQSRLLVRHTAQAGPVDVVLSQGGTTVGTLANLTNGTEQSVAVPPGDYDVGLFLAGTTTQVLGPIPVALEDGLVYPVQAVGVPGSPSFGLSVQSIDRAVEVEVVHGIPGAGVVDVVVNGAVATSLDYLETRSLVVPPGSYTLDVQVSGTSVLTGGAIGPAALEAADNVSVVAHLDATGTSNLLSLFANDDSPLPARFQSRVVVRHLAAAPPVDVDLTQAGTTTTLANLVNGNEASGVAPNAAGDVQIRAAGTNNVAFGPVEVVPTEQFTEIFYAVGDLAGGSFALVKQRIELLAAAPGTLTASINGTTCGSGTIGVSPTTFGFGDEFRLSYAGGPADAMAVVAIGASDTSFMGMALPFDLGPLGAAGCFLSVSPDIQNAAVLDANGELELCLAVPTTFADASFTAFVQLYVVDPSVPLGVTTTRYVSIQ